MTVEKCDCGRYACEFYDSTNDVSYTRAELWNKAGELKDTLASIQKVLNER